MTPRQRPVEINNERHSGERHRWARTGRGYRADDHRHARGAGPRPTGAAGGLVLAVALVLVRRKHVPSGPSGSDPTILFRAEPIKRDTPARDGSEHFVWVMPLQVPFPCDTSCARTLCSTLQNIEHFCSSSLSTCLKGAITLPMVEVPPSFALRVRNAEVGSSSLLPSTNFPEQFLQFRERVDGLLRPL